MHKQKNPRSRPKPVYHLHNWPEYDKALVNRFSLTFWISEDVYQRWSHDGPNQRGAQLRYSQQAIESMLLLKELFHLTNRGVEGFVRSLFQLAGISLPVPDHSTLSRRGKRLSVRLPRRAQGPLHIVMDSTGLKLYGEGEWKVRKHGWGKRRSWHKLHLMVDANSGEIQALHLTGAGGHDSQSVEPMLEQIAQPVECFTGDGGYDRRLTYQVIRARAPAAAIVIPPQENARLWHDGRPGEVFSPRNQAVRYIRKHGRCAWKTHSGYHRRSLAETTMFRLKTIFGDRLTTRQREAQANQVALRCKALNQMTHLGMPQSFKVA